MADRKWNRGAYHKPGPKHSTPPPGSGGAEVEEVLATIPRGDSDEMRVVVREYEGRPYLALQVYSADDSGELLAVRWKQTTIRLREIPEVVAALQKAERKLGGGKGAGSSSGRPSPKGKASPKADLATLPGMGEAPTGASSVGSSWIQPDDDEEAPF